MVPDGCIQNEIWLQLEHYKDVDGDFGLGRATEKKWFSSRLEKYILLIVHNFCYFESSISDILYIIFTFKRKFSNLCSLSIYLILSAALLWSDCGVHCPELQKLATQILSQTCYGSLRYKPKRGLDENLLTKGRNSAEQEQLYDPMFVHYNLHLWDSDWSTDSDIGFEETNQ